MRRPRYPRSAGDQRGAAMIEFIVLGVGVIVPLAYLAISAVTVQAAAFASTQAVREAGRAFSAATTAREGRARALVAAQFAFADQGMELPADALRITCAEGECLAPGSVVDVDLAWSVPLPWLPGSLAADVPARVPIEATHRVPVDDYRSSPGDLP